MNVTSYDGVPDSITELQESFKPNLTAVVDKLIATKSDAVLLCAYPPQVKFMVDVMKTRNYFPKLLVVNSIHLPYRFVITPRNSLPSSTLALSRFSQC
jgi:NAD(P)H-flavin reductase